MRPILSMHTPTTKLLFWFMALVLVLACAPTVATPAPTLDANSVQLIIQQTANAASTQTMSAFLAQPTATITATLPSTFTPEPTFTPVGPIIFPTTTPISQVQYYRVKHDSQLAVYNYKSRTAASDWPTEIWGLQTTEVVPLSVGRKIALGTHRTIMSGNWEVYLNALNGNNKQKLNYVKADNTALFDGAGFPQMESVTMGGNIITLDEIKDGWGRVHTFDYNNPGPLKDVNYFTNPDLIHKFVIVGWKRTNKTTFFANTPLGDLYWPLVSSRAVWIPMEYLEPFPILPMVVTAKKDQEIRVNPTLDSRKTGTLLKEGEKVRVVDYYPSASNVWGRVAGGGWIALVLYQNGPLQYPTTWEMATIPPIPPSE